MTLKILMQSFEQQEPAYTWNASWFNPFESAFSLLHKFALLNGLNIEAMARLFVARKPRGQITKAHNHGMSLARVEQVNIDTCCQLLRITSQQLLNAFPQPKFDPQLIPFSNQLRYCRRCLKRGYHSVLHQMEMFSECPIHRTRLLTGCPHCGKPIAYRVTASSLIAPFQCEHCEKPYAELLLERRMDQLKLPAEKMHILDELWQVLVYDPDHPKWGRHILDKTEFAWFDESIAHSGVTKRRADYLHFLCNVDHQLHPEQAISLPDPLHSVLEMGTTVRSLRVACNNSSPVRDQHHLLRWRNSNDLLWHLVPFYKALCRYLWRHVVNNHQHCIKTTVDHIWWQVHLTPTKPICPVSFAFVRWRMFWEGHSTPHRLMEPALHPPYRLLAWLSDAAPFCPPTWPTHIRYWLIGRVLINDLLASFYRELDESSKLSKRPIGKWKWHQELASGHNPTYWAVVESGDVPRILRAFFEPQENQAKHPVMSFDSTHLKQHKSAVFEADC